MLGSEAVSSILNSSFESSLEAAGLPRRELDDFVFQGPGLGPLLTRRQERDGEVGVKQSSSHINDAPGRLRVAMRLRTGVESMKVVLKLVSSERASMEEYKLTAKELNATFCRDVDGVIRVTGYLQSDVGWEIEMPYIERGDLLSWCERTKPSQWIRLMLLKQVYIRETEQMRQFVLKNIYNFIIAEVSGWLT